jgi:hypothetical protein
MLEAVPSARRDRVAQIPAEALVAPGEQEPLVEVRDGHFVAAGAAA